MSHPSSRAILEETTGQRSNSSVGPMEEEAAGSILIESGDVNGGGVDRCESEVFDLRKLGHSHDLLDLVDSFPSVGGFDSGDERELLRKRVRKRKSHLEKPTFNVFKDRWAEEVAVNYPRFSISRDDAGWRPSLDEVRPSLEGSGEEISEQTKEVREGHSSWEPDTPKVMVVCLDKSCKYDFYHVKDLCALGKKWLQPRAKIKTRFWGDVSYPNRKDMTSLDSSFEVHPLTSEDIFDLSKREKLERYEEYLYCVFNERYYDEEEGREMIQEVNILCYQDFILSIHLKPVMALPRVVYELQFGRDREAMLKDTVPGADWVLYKYLDVIVDGYYPLVSKVEREVDELDNFVDKTDFSGGHVKGMTQAELLGSIGNIKKWLASLNQDLMRKADIVSSLKHEKYSGLISPATVVYLRDVNDHIEVLRQKVNIANNQLQSLNATYLAKLSIEVAEASNRMNKLMKRFSAVGTIVLPLTLIAGLWGMNVEVPGQHWSPGFLWFILIVALMALFAIVMIILFWRKGWL